MGKNSAPSSQTTTATPWQPQGEQLQTLFDHANTYLDGGAPPVYQGNRVAGFNADQLAGMEAVRGNVGKVNSVSDQALQSSAQLLNASDVGNNPIVGNAIRASLQPVAETFTRKVLPQLRVNAVDAGNVGSSRQGVIEANATRDLNQTLSNLSGQLMGQFYNQGLDAQGKALALAPNTQGTVNAGTNELLSIGDAQQQLQQMILQGNISQFDETNAADLNHLMNFRNLITGGFGGSTTAPTGVQGASPLGSAIGGGMSGYALGTMLEMSNPGIMAGLGVASTLL